MTGRVHYAKCSANLPRIRQEAFTIRCPPNYDLGDSRKPVDKLRKVVASIRWKRWGNEKKTEGGTVPGVPAWVIPFRAWIQESGARLGMG